MHCYICDREDDLITFDKVQGKYSPCTVCQAIIEETLEEFEDNDDDEGEPSLDHAES